MADQPQDSALVNQSINWLVGLSGAALGGALLKFDWLLKLTLSAKVSFLVASFCFLMSILIGVFYAFQMLAVGRNKVALDEAKANWPPDDTVIDQAQQKFDRSRSKAKRYHLGTMITFALAGMATIVVLCIALLPSTIVVKETKIPPNKYLMTNAQVYLRGQLSHSHTFLLDQQTGEVWEMTCRKGGTVEFRHVERTNSDGSASVNQANNTGKKP